jgi:hypothetical protein
MEIDPIPCLELNEEHFLGLDLVGTVALPAPVPAVGRIYVVRSPPTKGAKGDAAKPRLLIKIVQKISESHVITRFVRPEHVRAIRLNPPKGSAASVEPTWLTGDHVRSEIATYDWGKGTKDKDDRSHLEVELRKDQPGVVYVHETAPVLFRHEQTLPAATSLEIAPGLRAAACPH